MMAQKKHLYGWRSLAPLRMDSQAPLTRWTQPRNVMKETLSKMRQETNHGSFRNHHGGSVQMIWKRVRLLIRMLSVCGKMQKRDSFEWLQKTLATFVKVTVSLPILLAQLITGIT